MYLPYDVFNNIIQYADTALLFNLYHTNSMVRKICLTDPFTKIVVTFSKNPYFNLNATSPVLMDFLDDLTDNNNMLKDLQLTLGNILMKKNQIILLNGSNNGKSTFLVLLNRLFGNLFCKMMITDINNDQDTYIVSLVESDS